MVSAFPRARADLPLHRDPRRLHPWDLLAVVPWVLSNVLAGSPVLMRPFVQPARYCAEKRNHYWRYERATRNDTGIATPDDIHPYPAKSDPISDRPNSVLQQLRTSRSLRRHGRLHSDLLAEPVRGVPVSSWIDFFKNHER